MARQVLENGVILPAEYSDDWYDDMTSNLTKLDDVIGSDSEKLSSADVGAAALSNSYNDLDNLPTIPTKTSDLTNDSNFVDTSNSAVASGITSAKVTSYDSHVADTDIHVTTADKTKWNNGVSQAYVFRYSSTALVASSTNSNTLLDNTDNLKVGDKVIDSSGVLFSITAIDTANSTFTIGSALIDLALDANVVHTSGNETISGQKTFANNRVIIGRNTDSNSVIQLVNSDVVGDSASGVSGFEVYGSSVSTDNKIGGLAIGEYSNNGVSYAIIECNRTVSDVKTSNTIRNLIRNDGSKEFSAGVDNDCKLGHPYFRWSKVYGIEYYYGSNNVEFSTKFVTSDSAQTITERKTFTKNVTIKNEDVTIGSTSGAGSKDLTFTDSADNALAKITANKVSNGSSSIAFRVDTTDSNDANINSQFQFFITKSGVKVIIPTLDNDISLGRTSNRWKDTCTYLINGLKPSALGMPDLANGVDISSYLTNAGTATPSEYTPLVDGYICIKISDNPPPFIRMYNDYGFDNIVYTERNEVGSTSGGTYTRFASLIFPANKNVKVYIIIMTSTFRLISAKFYPCQGNV